MAGGSNTLGSPDRWFDPSVFTLPAPGQYGNSGRNTLCGPTLSNFDFSLTKETKLKDKASLQFRAEFFNLLADGFPLGPPRIGNGPEARPTDVTFGKMRKWYYRE